MGERLSLKDAGKAHAAAKKWPPFGAAEARGPDCFLEAGANSYNDRYGAVTRDLGLRQDIVNVEGGAIAHGHAIGATGAVL